MLFENVCNVVRLVRGDNQSVELQGLYSFCETLLLTSY